MKTGLHWWVELVMVAALVNLSGILWYLRRVAVAAEATAEALSTLVEAIAAAVSVLAEREAPETLGSQRLRAPCSRCGDPIGLCRCKSESSSPSKV